MTRRRPNYRQIKIHRNYTVEEIGRLFGIHKNTIRVWMKAGLPVIDDRRPMLILGQDLAAFLQVRRNKNKRPCQPGEIYCVRCRGPKIPAGQMADYQPLTEAGGMLHWICPDCNSIMNRRVSRANLAHVHGKLDIAIPQARRRISNRVEPTVNSDLEQETKA